MALLLYKRLLLPYKRLLLGYKFCVSCNKKTECRLAPRYYFFINLIS